jgi:DNA-binding transcriptional ArsR family regulator
MVTRETPDIARYADRLAALGTEPRLRIVRLLLSAHPGGLVVGDIQAELPLAGPTLSHHLEKLRNEDLVTVQREGTYLRYRANVEALRDVLGFLLAECCGRNKVFNTDTITRMCKC